MSATARYKCPLTGTRRGLLQPTRTNTSHLYQVVAPPGTNVLASHLYRAESPPYINVATFVPGKRNLVQMSFHGSGGLRKFSSASLLHCTPSDIYCPLSLPGLSFLLSISSSDPLPSIISSLSHLFSLFSQARAGAQCVAMGAETGRAERHCCPV
jgi:hypothetical protein